MSFAIRRLPSLTIRWHSTLFQRLPSFPRRCYSRSAPSYESKLHLPTDPEEWKKLFKVWIQINHRVSLRNPETAAKIADAFVPEGSRDKVVIEAYPGPGQLTRALLDLPKERIKKLIVLENWSHYLDWLRPLKEVDPRIEIVEMDPFYWETYARVTELGLLDDVQKLEWNEGVHSEQLLSQFIRAMPDGQWLFTYGRVPLNFILSEHLYKRVVAKAGDHLTRCKLSIVAEAAASCTPTLDPEATQPYEQHFYPQPSLRGPVDLKKDTRAIGRPFLTMTVVPFEKQMIPKGQMDAWDFCLRRLYVKKSTELKKAINLLAPNAQILMGAVTDPNLPESERLDISKKIRNMTAHDWSILLKAFDEWPFKPEDLTIHEGYASSIRTL
ncbi:hypothetical protein C0995_016247 [Termitomyces sp. Mi166|nr:hypothetical protein C0995_016247 [Termitomyces sp. Mi166\